MYEPGTTPPLGALVHALEHGRVQLQYAEDAAPETAARLRLLVDELEGGYHLLLYQNRTGMPYAVAATAWDQLIGCPAMNEQVFDALRAFRNAYVDKGPELVPLAQRLQEPVRLAQRERDRVVAQRRGHARPGPHLELGGRRLDVAGRAVPAGVRSVAADDVREEAPRARGGVVALAPLHQRVDRRPQLLAARGQEQLVAPRRVRPPLDHARLDERVQARRQDRARDVEVALEVGEAAHAEEQVAQDQQRPALADDLERARQRAALAWVVGSERHPPPSVPDYDSIIEPRPAAAIAAGSASTLAVRAEQLGVEALVAAAAGDRGERAEEQRAAPRPAAW